MQNMDGKLLSGTYEGFRNIQIIPLVIRYVGAVPGVLLNPANEELTLTANGTGDLTIALANAGLCPLIVGGLAVQPLDAALLGNAINLSGATTSTELRLVNVSGLDGATEVDPVEIHITIIKMVAGS